MSVTLIFCLINIIEVNLEEAHPYNIIDYHEEQEHYRMAEQEQKFSSSPPGEQHIQMRTKRGLLGAEMEEEEKVMYKSPYQSD